MSTKETNFLAWGPIANLRVVNGGNNLDTCFQYAVKNEEGEKLLSIKVYDKLLEMISKDSTHMVGSKIKYILGSTKYKTILDKRIVDA